MSTRECEYSHTHVFSYADQLQITLGAIFAKVCPSIVTGCILFIHKVENNYALIRHVLATT